MKYQIVTSKRFKKDYKRAIKRGLKKETLLSVLADISNGNMPDKKYKPHKLSGEYDGYYECHIETDWLLVYKIYESSLIVFLVRTGTHSDLFN